MSYESWLSNQEEKRNEEELDDGCILCGREHGCSCDADYEFFIEERDNE
jgi:hypothetical protein